MTPKRVWVKLRGSQCQAFQVVVDERADCDDLKNIIKQRNAVEVEFIFTEEDGEDSKCKAGALISSFGPPLGYHASTPYYYSIAPPGPTDSFKWASQSEPMLPTTTQTALEKYRSVGRVLAGYPSAYDDITAALRSIQRETQTISPFVVIDAPSGSGKTQLGFVLDSLGFQVVHFTLHPVSEETDQAIYLAMNATSINIQRAIVNDLFSLPTDELSVTSLKQRKEPLRLVQFWFLSLFAQPDRKWDLCTVPQLLAIVSSLREFDKLPVVLVDEVGNNRDFSGNIVQDDMNRVHYIRNLCRACRIPCVFMGTNSNAMNMVRVALGARTNGPMRWCKLITRLPRVPESHDALQLSSAENILILNGHVELAAFLRETAATTNPLFLSKVVDAILSLKEWQPSTAKVLNGLLARTSTWLLSRKPQLKSLLGLRGQLALQLSMYREEPVQIPVSICQNILNFRSASFVAAHFARLNAPRDITDLYVSIGSNEETQETSTLAYNPDTNGSDFPLQRWIPSASFPPAAEDPLLYLLFGGGMDAKHPPAFCFDTTKPLTTGYALQAVTERLRNSPEYLTRNLDLSNSESQKRSGDSLEALTSVAVVTASRRNGVEGMSLSCFLCRLAEEFVVSRNGQRVQVRWGEEPFLTKLDDLLEVVPYLGPFNTNWPASLFALPGCRFGHFRRTRDAEHVDISVSVPSSAGAATAAASSSSEAQTVVVFGECKNYSLELDKEDTTKILTRALEKYRDNDGHHRVHLAFVSKLSTGVFQKSSWSKWKKDNAGRINLQVARVNLSRVPSDSQSLFLSLANLSNYAASLDLNSQCDLLVLFIVVEPWQDVLKTVHAPPPSPISSKRPLASLWSWLRK